MKKALRIIGTVIAAILILAAGLLVAVQSPSVQSWMLNTVLNRMFKDSKAEISIGDVSIRPFQAISLSDVLLKDSAPLADGCDTVLYAGRLSAKFSLAGLLKGEAASVSRINLDSAKVNFVIEDTLGGLNFTRALGIESQDSGEPMGWGDILNAGRVHLSGVLFRMVNLPARADSAELYPGTINWADFSVYIREFKAHNIDVKNSQVFARVDRLSAREMGSGLDIEEASARKVRVGKGLVKIDGVHLKDTDSDLYLKSIELEGALDDYADFINKIRVRGQFSKGSVLSMKSISHFAQGLDRMSAVMELEGKADGTVSSFRVDNLSFRERGSGVSAKISGSMSGLPEIGTSILDMEARNLEFTGKGIGLFVKAFAPETDIDLSSIAPGIKFVFDGSISGPFSNLDVKGNIVNGSGKVITDVSLRDLIEETRPTGISGRVEARDLDLGVILGMKELGPLTMTAEADAVFSDDGPNVDIASLQVQRLSVLGYDYSNLSAKGTYTGSTFDGRFFSGDPNLDFLFQGTFALSKRNKNAVYRFVAILGNADLHALKLDKRERSRVSFYASSDFRRTEDRNLLGDILISDIELESDDGRHDIGNISIAAHEGNNISRMQLNSSFIEGGFSGDKSIFSFVNDLRSLIVDRPLPALTEEHATEWNGDSYSLWLKVHDATKVLDFFAPGTYVENGSGVNLTLDALGNVKGNVSSGRIAYNGKYVKGLNLDIDSSADALLAKLSGNSVSLGGGSGINDNFITLFAKDNSVGLGYSFDNGTEESTKAEVYLTGDIRRDRKGLTLTARAHPSNIYYNGDGWSISSGDIVLNNSDVHIDRLVARHDTQELLLDGGFSQKRKDTLSVSLRKFDLALLDNITGQYPPLEGKASGNALLLSPLSPTPGLLASIVCDSVKVSGNKAGTVSMLSRWSDKANAFIFSLKNELNGINNISVRGSLNPGNGTLMANANLNRLDMGYLGFLLEGVFTDVGGALSGEIGLEGKDGKMDINSKDLRLNDGRLMLDYTKVPYQVEGDLTFDNEGLHFDNVALTDGENGRGTVTGLIDFGGFASIKLGIDLEFADTKLLAIQRGENPDVFGTVYGSGKAQVVGPLHNVNLLVDATTNGEGNVHVPLDSQAQDRTRDLLTFREAEFDIETDPYDLLNAETESHRASDFRALLNIHALPDVSVFVDLDRENSISGNGSGNIVLESRAARGIFTLNGDYTFSRGNFHFSAMNLVSRDFSIQDGSLVRFNGAVMDTDLSVDGLYTTKASIANLIGDENATSLRTVNCGIHISDKLRNPQVNFSIDVPDLNPTTQAMVESSLNTEDKIQKQFVYLLLAGGFLPEEESGITSSGSEMLYSNVSGIMAGQINNIFQTLDIPLDLGLNYRPTETGDNMFDVALSTQLFNDRVIVNGSVGNKRQYGMTTNEVAGDIDVEVKVNKSGNLRFNLFSHSADEFTSYLDNSQRNGVGIAYQREFNTLRQFFRELGMSRQERELAAARAALEPQEYVVMEVEGNELR